MLSPLTFRCSCCLFSGLGYPVYAAMLWTLLNAIRKDKRQTESAAILNIERVVAAVEKWGFLPYPAGGRTTEQESKRQVEAAMITLNCALNELSKAVASRAAATTAPTTTTTASHVSRLACRVIAWLLA